MKKILPYLWIAIIFILALNTTVTFLRGKIDEFGDWEHFLIIATFFGVTIASMRCIEKNGISGSKVIEIFPAEDALINSPFTFEIIGLLSDKAKIITCRYESGDTKHLYHYYVETEEKVGSFGTGIIEERILPGIGKTFCFTIKKISAHSHILRPASA